jgi:hypothetical protein
LSIVDAKKSFLRKRALSLTVGASTRRGNMYTAALTESQRRLIQRTIRERLTSLESIYRNAVTEQDHIANISALANTVSKEHSGLLNDGRMKFGHAQKAVNLYLKHMWCLGEIPAPPHCPLDANILRKLPGFGNVRWTQIDDPTIYRSIIDVAKRIATAKGLSLAEWELNEFDDSDT